MHYAPTCGQSNHRPRVSMELPAPGRINLPPRDPGGLQPQRQVGRQDMADQCSSPFAVKRFEHGVVAPVQTAPVEQHPVIEVQADVGAAMPQTFAPAETFQWNPLQARTEVP